jgi:APA family basic amino acid/polyamine antiporter
MKPTENLLVFYGWSFFAVIQTGTIAAVGCQVYSPSVSSFSDSNILYEIGDFKLNAAQIVSISYDCFT